MANDEIITLAYGSGGKKTSELIDEIIVPAFNNPELSKLSDGALLNSENKIVFSTDSFVINPYFFPGGDIGKLSVCGTVNDLCMCGGEPKYLSLSFIIEEGFLFSHLIKIVDSIKTTAAECGVKIVTGDTKVVERGKGDGIYINTAGIGFLRHEGLGEDSIKDGDAIIVTGTMGDHGISVMAARNNLISGSELLSDCRTLHRLTEEMAKFKEDVRIMRDPTRGGLATTLNEFVERNNLTIELEEESIPIKTAVANACEILGLDPLYSANEGKFVAVVSANRAEEIVSALKKFPEGADAAIIGRVTSKYPGKVVIKTYLGGTRILAKLTGAQLPRIC
jgi:hydrogenase expression/formation protein HypE